MDSARYPKRKRVQIDYYEQDVEVDSQAQNESQDFEHHSQPKKSKKSRASSKPLPKRKIFPFLELPAEIKNMIYAHCLTDPAGIYLCSSTKKLRRTVHRVPEEILRPHIGYNYNWTNNDSDEEGQAKKKEASKPCEEIAPLVPALLAVCKQIYHEGRDMLYDNTFYFNDTLVMHSFLVDIGPRAASLLKTLKLVHWGMGRGVHKAYNHAGFAALQTATNIKTFTVYGTMSYRVDAKSTAQQFYRDAFPWLEAVGMAKGKTDAAVDLIEISCEELTGYMANRYRNCVQKGYYQDIDGFRSELSKILHARMKMIRS